MEIFTFLYLLFYAIVAIPVIIVGGYIIVNLFKTIIGKN